MTLNVTPKDLLDAGVHFGHQTRRWNPRSKPYVYDHRQGITIIDLGKTHELLQKAADFIEETVAKGGNVLFVGTKKQAREMVKEAAASTNMPCCVDRWLGGTLTNFVTVKKSIAKYKKYQAMETSGELDKLPSKEASAIRREMVRMTKNFSGIVEMPDLPSALFVIDGNHEKIAVAEAKRCAIPCAGLIDTNSDPTALSHPIPGNDDAQKSIRIILNTIVEAVQSGIAQRESRRAARGQADAAAQTALAAEAAGIPAEQPADGQPADAPSAKPAAAKKRPARKKVAAPKTEAPAEQPAAEQPAAEQPADAAPAPEQPAAEQPAAE
jgi:small subunit ribosomal protein S2